MEYWCLFCFPGGNKHCSYVVSKFRRSCKRPLEQLSESRSGHGEVLAELLAAVSVLLQGLYRWRDAVALSPEGDVKIRLLDVISGVIQELEGEAGKVIKAVVAWFFKDVVKKVEEGGANLAQLDDIVDEMAFSSNLLMRYCNFAGEGGADAQLQQIRGAYEKAEVGICSARLAFTLRALLA